jgi:CubicO group peptidase (beta-lactamase class C family)
MVDTGFYVPEAKADRLPPIYSRPEGAEALTRIDSPAWAPSTSPPSFLMGGGGLASTTSDYARFAQMLAAGGELNGVRLLSPITVAMFTVNQAPLAALAAGYDGYERGYGYSLGTSVLMNPAKTGMAGSTGEFGWSGAFGTYFWVDPVLDLYGILMTQYPDPLNPHQTLLKQLTYQAMVR